MLNYFTQPYINSYLASLKADDKKTTTVKAQGPYSILLNEDTRAPIVNNASNYDVSVGDNGWIYYTGLDKDGVEVTYVDKYGSAADLDKNTSGGSGGSGGGGSSSTTVTAQPTATKHDWLNESPERIAELIGIEHNTYEEILDLYNNASNAKFDELDTQTKRNQSENLRTLEGQYETYLNTIRNDRANAVSSGMTKGTAAANMLATNFANAATISEGQQAYEDLAYDLTQQRATSLEENAILAQQEMSDLGQYIGNLKGTYENVAVSELAALLAAESQIKSAQIAANATTSAAKTAAGASTNTANSQAQWLLDLFIQDAGSTEQGIKNYLSYYPTQSS